MTDKTADFEEPCPDVVTAGDLVGLRRQEWPPERLRTLDRAVAEARGAHQIGECPKCYSHFVVPSPIPAGGLFCPECPKGGLRGVLQIVDDPPVSLGCRGTFDLMEEFRNVTWELRQDRLGRFLFAWVDDVSGNWGAPVMAPTMPIAICLAHLASKGRVFNG